MFKYIVKRIVIALVILLFVSIILYILLRCMPVSYIESRLAALQQNADEEAKEVIRKAMLQAYGLDNNVIGGYFQWLGNIFQGNFGTSFLGGSPVLAEIFRADRIGTSFLVALVSTIFEFLIAIPLGITAATHQYAIRDYVVTILVLIGISLPSFFFGQVLKWVFADVLSWFPASGTIGAGTAIGSSWIQTVGDYLWHVTLPIITVVILSIGGRMRMTRTNMLEVLNADYIRTARAKGLKERNVIYKHAFRNTMIPIVTDLAGLIPGLFSGAMITESVFDLEGIGKFALSAMQAGDIPVIMTYNMFLAILSVVGVLLADLMYAVVDPRVKLV
ncbi:MAG: ABC transporter permease [Bacteroidales bacterium]|nr:ABC transporter permease [Bacteroidales bacterium]